MHQLPQLRLAAACILHLTLTACVPLAQQAAQGDAEAQFRYGRQLLTAKGAARDTPGAFAWFQAAADQEHPRATAALALCHENGWGTPRDRQLARKCYTQAATLGHPESFQMLAAMDLEDGDADQAARHLEPLCQWHDLQSEIMLAILFMSRNSPYYNPDKGIRYLRYAALDGSPEAAKMLSTCYKRGLGVPRSETLADGWLKISQDPRLLQL